MRVTEDLLDAINDYLSETEWWDVLYIVQHTVDRPAFSDDQYEEVLEQVPETIKEYGCNYGGVGLSGVFDRAEYLDFVDTEYPDRNFSDTELGWIIEHAPLILARIILRKSIRWICFNLNITYGYWAKLERGEYNMSDEMKKKIYPALTDMIDDKLEEMEA